MISILAATLFAGVNTGDLDGNASTYTRIFEPGCTEQEIGGGIEIRCAGYGDWQLNISAGEHGQAIQYVHPARGQSGWLGTPNRGLWGGYNNVIEWRLEGERAFATIHRYRYDTPAEVARDTVYAERAEVLVVTALQSDTACVIAYLDPLSLTDSNVWARRIADTYASSWDCANGQAMDLDASTEVELTHIQADYEALGRN